MLKLFKRRERTTIVEFDRSELQIRDLLEHQVELVIDGGFCGLEPTTVVDLTEDVPRVARVGCGSVAEFETGD